MARFAKVVLFLILTFVLALFGVSRYVVHYDAGIERAVGVLADGAGASAGGTGGRAQQTLLEGVDRDARIYAAGKVLSLWVPACFLLLLVYVRLVSAPPRPGLAAVFVLCAGALAFSAAVNAVYAHHLSLPPTPERVLGSFALLVPVAVLAVLAALVGCWSLDGAGGASRPRSKALLILLPAGVVASAYGGYDLYAAGRPIGLFGWSSPAQLYEGLSLGVGRRVSGLRGDYVAFPTGRRALFVRGRIVNLPPRDRGRVRVRVDLVGPDGRVLATRRVLPGVSLSNSDLATLDFQEIRERLERAGDGRAASAGLPPAFTAVFSPSPGGVREIRAAVIPDRLQEIGQPAARLLLTRMAEQMGEAVPLRGRAPVRRGEPAGRSPDRDVAARMQALLNRLGYDAGPVDGIPGRRTRLALTAFQKRNGLPATGNADPATLERLFSGDGLAAGPRSRSPEAGR